MSLFNTGKNKDKKKASQTAGKPTMVQSSSTKSNSKSAAKATRVSGRAQRGS